MKYYSLNNNKHTATFKEAVVNGIAPDKGLYFPEKIPQLSKDFIENISNFSNVEIAYELIKEYIGNEIAEVELKKIIAETLSFDFPIIEIENNCKILELFHGPTLAFKDVGARFMARCLAFFNKNNSKNVTVLVATSGDTGGAVADGFFNMQGINVVILYPKGRVSEIQEKQLTTFGKNIQAIEVNGNFDDCQAMVKNAFLDVEITQKITLTSANSINIARWLPQMFYYAFAYKELVKQGHSKIVFSVPSGNFGNICAGIILKKMGLPIHHFIAACNANDVIPKYFETGILNEKPSVATISNAMDVALPSNFVRILELYNHDFSSIKKDITAYSFNDDETREKMKEVFNKNQYTLDPHGAVAYLGLDKYLLNKTENEVGVVLETAHPCKFIETVESVLNQKIDIPHNVLPLLSAKKLSTEISTYSELKEFLIV